MSRRKPEKKPGHLTHNDHEDEQHLSVDARLTLLERQVSRRSWLDVLALPLAVSAGGTVLAFIATDRLAGFLQDKHDIGIMAAYADTVNNLEVPTNAPEGYAVLFLLVVNNGDFTEEEVRIEVQFSANEDFEVSTHFAVSMFNDLIFDSADLELITYEPGFKVMQTRFALMHPDENTAFWFYISRKVNVRAFVRSQDDFADAEIILDNATPSANR